MKKEIHSINTIHLISSPLPSVQIYSLINSDSASFSLVLFLYLFYYLSPAIAALLSFDRIDAATRPLNNYTNQRRAQSRASP